MYLCEKEVQAKEKFKYYTMLSIQKRTLSIVVLGMSITVQISFKMHTFRCLHVLFLFNDLFW